MKITLAAVEDPVSPPVDERMSGTSARAGPDAGLATVWAAGAVAVLVGAMTIGLHIGAAVVARHRAESAADLAALAAARLAAEGTERACRRAGEIAAATGTRVVFCRLSGWEALIEVEAPVAVALTGGGVAAGRARAGPADGTVATPQPDSRSTRGTTRTSNPRRRRANRREPRPGPQRPVVARSRAPTRPPFPDQPEPSCLRQSDLAERVELGRRRRPGGARRRPPARVARLACAYGGGLAPSSRLGRCR